MAVAWTFGILAVGFVGVQFVRPELTSPPVTADLDAPSDVKTILKTSCYNCHSNETKLPWFDRIVPAYWVAARDVKLGRARLNFSEIGKLPAGQQKAALFESVSQIELGAMPLLPVSPGASRIRDPAGRVGSVEVLSRACRSAPAIHE